MENRVLNKEDKISRSYKYKNIFLFISFKPNRQTNGQNIYTIDA